jgi:Mn-dependent DtxR family transcriptional regulator
MEPTADDAIEYLVEEGYMTRTDDGVYMLTEAGRAWADLRRGEHKGDA